MVILRLLEISFAAVVAGIIGHYLTLQDSDSSERILYTIVLAGISLFFALVFLPPFKYSFYSFTIDFILFICWMVDFGLLVNVSYSLPSRCKIANPTVLSSAVVAAQGGIRYVGVASGGDG